MLTLGIALLVAGFVLFICVAVGVKSERINLMALGLGCWVLSELIAMFYH